MTNRIKQVRVLKGITQEQLANLTGVRRETIVFLESSKYIPSLRLAFRAAKTLGMSIEELFSFEDETEDAKPKRKH